MDLVRRALPFLLWAAMGAAQGDERPRLETVSTSEQYAVEGGAWRWLLERTAAPWSCGTAQEPARCVEHALLIDNATPQTLECVAGFAYATADGGRVSDPDMPALVLPRSRHEMRGRITAEATRVEVTRLECRARPPYVRLAVPAGCKYEMHGNPLESYYPPAAMRLALEGPVTVSFLLASRSGRASEVAIAESSLVPMLDDAAKRFVADQVFSTKCAGSRFDVRVRFALRDRYAGARPD